MAKHTMDLTTGSVTKKLLLFMLPILATNLLQQFYTAADTAVVGKFASETALAAVGSTSHITSLLLSLFVGLATGTNVVCAKYFGAKNQEKLRVCMHTSLIVSAICGVFEILAESRLDKTLGRGLISSPSLPWLHLKVVPQFGQ